MGRKKTKPQKITNGSESGTSDKEKTTSEENKEWELEKIVGKRTRLGKIEYEVKWKDYPSSQNTWEPAENLECVEMIQQYENELSGGLGGGAGDASVSGVHVKQEQPDIDDLQEQAGSSQMELHQEEQEEDGNEEEDEEEEEKEKEWEVEQICGRKWHRGTISYLVKWKDYSWEENTWEPLTNLDCPELIMQYESKLTKKQRSSRATFQDSPPKKTPKKVAAKKSAPIKVKWKSPKRASKLMASADNSANSTPSASKKQGLLSSGDESSSRVENDSVVAEVEEATSNNEQSQVPQSKVVQNVPEEELAGLEKLQVVKTEVDEPEQVIATSEKEYVEPQEKEVVTPAKTINKLDTQALTPNVESSEQQYSSQEIEKITDKKIIRGKTRYYVQFKTEQSKPNAWINKELLTCNELIQAYETKFTPSRQSSRKAKPNAALQAFKASLNQSQKRGIKAHSRQVQNEREAAAAAAAKKKLTPVKAVPLSKSSTPAASNKRKRKLDEQKEVSAEVPTETPAPIIVAPADDELSVSNKKKMKLMEAFLQAEHKDDDESDKMEVSAVPPEEIMEVDNKNEEEVEKEKVEPERADKQKEAEKKENTFAMEVQSTEKESQKPVSADEKDCEADRKGNEVDEKEQETPELLTNSIETDNQQPASAEMKEPEKDIKSLDEAAVDKGEEKNIPEPPHQVEIAEKVSDLVPENIQLPMSIDDLPDLDSGSEMPVVETEAKELSAPKPVVEKSQKDKSSPQGAAGLVAEKLVEKAKSPVVSPSKASKSPVKSPKKLTKKPVAVAKKAAQLVSDELLDEDAVIWNKKGSKVEEVLRATKFQGVLKLLVKYEETGNREYVKSRLVNLKYPQKVIKYYESIRFCQKEE